MRILTRAPREVGLKLRTTLETATRGRLKRLLVILVMLLLFLSGVLSLFLFR